MPAQAHLLVTFGGTTQSGTGDAEIWQCGVKLGQVSGTTATGVSVDDLTGYVNSIQAALNTWFHAATSKMRVDYLLTWVKAANIGNGTTTNKYGKYAGTTDHNGGPNPAVFSYGAGITGGGALTGVAPPFVTLALTWRNSHAPKGPRHAASHGRIYPPFAVASATSRLSGGAGTANSYVQAGTDLLTLLSKPSVGIGGGSTGAIKPCLFGADGTCNVIDQVSVGDVLDTIRRRKDKLREAYATAAWS